MMRKISFIIFLFIGIITNAQTFTQKIDKISEEIEQVKLEEKQALKEKIKQINAQISAGDLSEKAGTKLKVDAANEHARNIEKRVEILEAELKKLVQEKASFSEEETTSKSKEKKGVNIDADIQISSKKNKNEDFDEDKPTSKKTRKSYYSYYYKDDFLIIGFGLQNALVDGNINSLENSDFRIWQSPFIEIGYLRAHSLFKDKRFLELRYGVSLTWNTLRIDNNQYFVKEGNKTVLMNFPHDVKYAKLNILRFEVPVLFNFNFGNINLGLGSYGSVHIRTKQCIKYVAEDGSTHKDKVKNEFNTTNFSYGFMTTFGIDEWNIYAKYSPTPIFKNSNLSSLAVGLRLEL
ncbi:Na/Pi cotransporter family protein [Aureivirga marina]|uniref:hypothetical protein n=1 Tax=Aureivirga marina TaxID=1182451 RepID=UPI0018CB2889|nr:hypothetical protein [Aureivirga marina]